MITASAPAARAHDERAAPPPRREDLATPLDRLVRFQRRSESLAVDIRDLEEMEVTLDPLELVHTMLGERDPRSEHEVTERGGHEDFAGPRHGHHPRRRVHDEAPGLPADRLELPEADARPDLDPELSNGLGRCDRGPDRIRRSLERDEEPVARRVDLVPAEAAHRAPHDPMVPLDEFAPAGIPHLRRDRRRAHDVGEQDRSKTASSAAALHVRECRFAPFRGRTEDVRRSSLTDFARTNGDTVPLPVSRALPPPP